MKRDNLQEMSFKDITEIDLHITAFVFYFINLRWSFITMSLKYFQTLLLNNKKLASFIVNLIEQMRNLKNV